MQSNNNDKLELDRREMLKQTAATTVGGASALSAMFGTVHAESTTEAEASRIESAPGVQQILDELGRDSLPDPEDIEKRRIDDDGEATDGELTIWKADLGYGILTAVGRDSTIRAVFNFDVDLDSAPAGYPVVTEHGGSLGSNGSELEFTRHATDAEEDLVMSALEVDGEIEGGRVFASTAVDGFKAAVTVSQPGSDQATSKQFTATVGSSFDPRTDTLSVQTGSRRGRSQGPTTVTPGDLTVRSRPVTAQSPWVPAANLVREVLEDWIVGNLADEPLEYLGVECDDTCSSCATYIVDILSTCRWCISLCSTSASGVTAILCVVCFYAFCNDSLKQVNCAACFACLITGDEPDIPGSTSAAAFSWVWDQIPSTPSVSDIPGGGLFS